MSRLALLLSKHVSAHSQNLTVSLLPIATALMEMIMVMMLMMLIMIWTLATTVTIMKVMTWTLPLLMPMNQLRMRPTKKTLTKI